MMLAATDNKTSLIQAMRRQMRTALDIMDAAAARLYLSVKSERPLLLTLLFHVLFRDSREAGENYVHPQQNMTVGCFRHIIEYFLRNGYCFVSPHDVLQGLDPSKKYVMLTFDDGYFNNSLALPVLREFNVPAVFYISTNHVRQGKNFWWDVVYRQALRANTTPAVIVQQLTELKRLRNADIETQLKQRFGPACLTPLNDVDRPFTAHELRDFAREKHVHIGNHTADHAILTNYRADEVEQQINDCQQALREMMGIEAESIAYPNGCYDQQTLEISRKVGLKLGVTVEQHKNPLPLGEEPLALMRLGRFLPWARPDMDRQCELFRSDVIPSKWVRRVWQRLMISQILNDRQTV
jgi:peptidoglycan/xylan/chitin deacetylase (PgdA/CDA1 family)